jgi:hypothetical protein
VLELPGGELPFGLDVAKEESWVLYLVNGEDRVRVPDVTVSDGRLTAILADGNTLTAEIRGGELNGDVSLRQAGGEPRSLPFRAERGQAWRFFEEASTDNTDVAGRWSVTFTSDGGESTPGIAEFAQSFERVTGTFVTAAGDRSLLVGEVHGDELFLSRCDGTSAELARARVDDQGQLVGEYWSGMGRHESFRAERDPDAAPVTGASAP